MAPRGGTVHRPCLLRPERKRAPKREFCAVARRWWTGAAEGRHESRSNMYSDVHRTETCGVQRDTDVPSSAERLRRQLRIYESQPARGGRPLWRRMARRMKSDPATKEKRHDPH